MFTEEEKIRAIELYFKYGKKLAPVVRELGYPSKSNLRRWIRSWEVGGGANESIRHKHRYSDEQKQVAVEHYLNHGCCLAFTSRTRVIPAPMCSLAGLMNSPMILQAFDTLLSSSARLSKPALCLITGLVV